MQARRRIRWPRRQAEGVWVPKLSAGLPPVKHCARVDTRVAYLPRMTQQTRVANAQLRAAVEDWASQERGCRVVTRLQARNGSRAGRQITSTVWGRSRERFEHSQCQARGKRLLRDAFRPFGRGADRRAWTAIGA
eukprot:363938-Chlamydomonas_euryale.AAC.5